MHHRTIEELESGLHAIRASPRSGGVLELLVRRPDVDEREVLDEGRLDRAEGLVGDGWLARATGHGVGGSPHHGNQVTVMNARCVDLLAQSRGRWPLAGDQLYVDFDLSVEFLPAGTRLAVGAAVIEVSDIPHTGCAKFSRRFGADALRFVNTEEGRALRLRGLNAEVVEAATIRLGDTVTRL